MAMKGHADLLDSIDWSSVECLNQHHDHNVNNVLKGSYRDDRSLYLESDTDEQLLLHVPFNQSVKLSSITIMAADQASAPKHVRLFVNRPTIGFSEAADDPAVQEFDLTEKELTGSPVALRFAKFQAVNCISIFIQSNQEDEDTTKLIKIVLTGSTGETFNVAEIKKQGEES